jgi:hypothetical protein
MKVMPVVCTALLFAVLGAMVNLAIAWGSLAIDVDPIRSHIRANPPNGLAWQSNHSPDNWSIIRADRFCMTALKSQSTGTAGPATPLIGAQSVPRWSILNHAPSARRDLVPWRVLEDARGWPMRSLLSLYLNSPRRIGDPYLNVIAGAPIAALSRPGFSGRQYIALPTRPLWTGTLVNTIFYGVLLWLLAGGPFRSRRQWRQGRGLCLRCGYDLRGADHARCPECGTTPTSRAAASGP